MTQTRWILASGLLVLVAACSGDDDSRDAGPQQVVQLTQEQLLDPESCKDCHPKHYEEWSASMHAYAGRDPVFLAMNKRMQEEAPQHKEFCVQCHAPMALRTNSITDFSDLSTLPKHLQGVTCYFCHNAINVREPHNNANIDLANDTIMRGAFGDPVAEAAAHGVTTKSQWHDPSKLESSQMCGTCHDIQTPAGIMIERTFSEYMQSVSSQPGAGSFNSCQDCHMKKKPLREPAAMVKGVGNRTVHSHLFPAVDVALTPDLPNQAELRAAIEKSELQACTLSQMTVEIGDWSPNLPFQFVVTLEQLAGHSFPSGASADRRLWVQSALYDEAGQLIFESGKVADGELEVKPEDDLRHDSQLVPFRDHLIDANGKETHMFWEAALPSKSDLMPFATNADAAVPHYTRRTISTRSGLLKAPARIELWLRLRPMGVDVLQDLVKSGHLDPSFVSKMPTLTVAHREYIYNDSNKSYTETDLITDSECKTPQSLSELTSGM
jgi:hypothetical protein